MLFSAAAAHASTLAVGSAILSAPGAGPTGGTVLANSGAVAFTSGTFQGTLTSTVILNDPSNPFGLGNLTFTYLLKNSTGPDSIERLTIPGYGIAGVSTDASYQSPISVGAVLPTSFDRSSAATLGDVVGVSFTSAPLGLGVLPPTATSALIVIQTNSTQFNTSTASVIDGSTAQVSTYAPKTGVSIPEPSALILGFLGFAGLGAIGRSRRLRS